MKNMDKRSEAVLSELIGSFIATGQAIGSSTIAEKMSNTISSATIRKVMADLENAGFLTHRHTSAGRIPTEKGIRYYVDQLVEVNDISEESLISIKRGYKNISYSVTDVCKETSRILSRLSHYAGLVVAPKLNEIIIKYVEFIPLSDKRVLGIFVGRDGVVENRIIKVEKRYTYSELEKVNNYCNRAFYGLTINEVKTKVAMEIEQANREYKDFLSSALLLSQKMFFDIEDSNIFIDGSSHMVSAPDFDHEGKLSVIMEMLEEKKRLADFLDNIDSGNNVQIFIGSESGLSQMSDCSLIAASYKRCGKMLGTLGVIGPTRMNYSKVIPIVDCTARLIGDILNGEE